MVAPNRETGIGRGGLQGGWLTFSRRARRGGPVRALARAARVLGRTKFESVRKQIEASFIPKEACTPSFAGALSVTPREMKELEPASGNGDVSPLPWQQAAVVMYATGSTGREIAKVFDRTPQL